MRNVANFTLLLIALAIAGGCSKIDPRIAPLRERFLLPEEPTGAVTIAESRDGIAPDQDSEKDVVIVGRIDAGEFEPWAAGQASFLLSEVPPDDAHASTPGHDPATCPFCRRRAQKANAQALVQFRDDKGEVLAIDARELLGVAKDQVVVVRGKGHVDKLGVLVVSATGIHVRR